jgi:hypothetical protein
VSAWLGRLRRILDLDPVRAPLLLVYYVALIYVLVRMYGGAHPAPPVPFVYQGF